MAAPDLRHGLEVQRTSVDMLAIISSRCQYGPFLFFFVVAEVMSNYLTTDGLKFFSLLHEAPLRPEARGICHICHVANRALINKRLAFKIVADWELKVVVSRTELIRIAFD